MFKSSKKIPLSRALLWILGSTLLISGSAFMGQLYFLHVKEKRMHDDQYRIVAIVQSSSQADSLKTGYLAEILGLSLDKPSNLYQFDSNKGVQKLLENPLIKEASIQKVLPGTLYVHYQMRIPVAYIGEYANTVIDSEGFLFPFRPFFTPKRLPVLFLGLQEKQWTWGSSLKDHPSLKLANSILKQYDSLNQEGLAIKQVDVSQAQADSYGQRQAVVILVERGSLWNLAPNAARLFYLRLNPDDTAQALTNFHALYGKLFDLHEDSPSKSFENENPVLIDLRIPHLAFVKRGS